MIRANTASKEEYGHNDNTWHIFVQSKCKYGKEREYS